MTVDTTDLAATLNPPQLEAVTAPDGPLLVFAGAGSGKTRVLTYRIAHLIQTGRAHPDQVLAVTFTNKAAREMRERIAAIVGADRAPAWMGTFHSICGRILRRDGQLIGINRSYVIYDEADRLASMKRAMQRLGLDEKRFPPGAVVQKISHAKNEMLGPEEFAAAADDYFAEVVGRVYPLYEASMRDASALDFDDMLLMAVRLFREGKGALEKWQRRFNHVLVDEYQDTNLVQYTLVQMLCEEHRNLCVVGDDDQSIYRFRGADVRNILGFERDFPEARVVKLEQNYRSTQNILDAAHAVIKAVPDRAEKTLWTDAGPGQRVMLAQVYDEQEEAEALAGEIRRLTSGEGEMSLRDIAVLYRTNAQSRALEETLVRQGIPYKLIGGVRFYERREIKDALAYLRLVFNPSDVVAFRRIINVPRRKIGDKTVALIEAEATAQGSSLSDVLSEPVKIPGLGSAAILALTEFRDLINGLRADLDAKVALPDLIEDLLVRTGLQRMYNDGTEEGAERWQNLLEFKGLASEYAGLEGSEALARMLEDAALVSDVDDLDESKPGITLITLHMVKGLEFPVVFMVGMEEGLLPHMRALEEPGGVDEERRLCYVGMTRAMRRLYLFHTFRRHLFGVANLNLPSRFLAELPEAIIERPAGSTRPVPGRSVLDQVSRRPPAPAEPVVQRYREGQRVKHRTFGEGLVVKSTLTRTDEELIVRFDGPGIKIISATLAPLEAV
ncbi:MAG: ATP-dependent helicase UvrD/PcrA [Chloroflexota bacterium]|jgi:DNA helicase-2/ATP-dependent DNA helicase PcrA|nr:ATP-dependent helicase UvrD/PcrA [Chloroflexota bacterium]